MKKMIRFILLALVAVLCVACGKDNPGTGGGGSKDPMGSYDSVCGVDRTNIKKSDIVHLTYASFDDQELEQSMICEFQKQNPTIEVTLRNDVLETYGTDNFSYGIAEMAAIGDTIDVFQVYMMDIMVNNKLVYDIADLWNNDPDTSHVFTDAAKAAKYGDVKLGMANGQTFAGVFINMDLLNHLNLDLENYGFDYETGDIWNYNQMIQLARDFTSRARTTYNNKYYYGLEGEWNNLNFSWILPAMDNLNYGMNSFDGTSFHFTDENYIKLYQSEVDLGIEGIKANIKSRTEEAQTEFGTTNPDLFFEFQRALLYTTYSWTFDRIDEMDFDYMFLPYPKGIAEDAEARIASSIGVLSLSSTTQHPNEAYKLAKFMSWGEEGAKTRLRLTTEAGKRMTKFPVSDFDVVWNNIAEIYTDSSSEMFVNGFDIIMNSMLDTKQTVMDFGKWLPGYSTFKAWYTNVQTESHQKDVANGLMKFADVAKVWEDKANSSVSELLEKYKKYPNMSE